MAKERRTPYEIEQHRDQAQAFLKKQLTKTNRTVYVVTKSVSESGMSRQLLVFAIVKEQYPGQPATRRIRNIGWHVRGMLGLRMDPDTHAVTIRGTGMDMHFALVNELSHAVFGDPTILKKESL